MFWKRISETIVNFDSSNLFEELDFFAHFERFHYLRFFKRYDLHLNSLVKDLRCQNAPSILPKMLLVKCDLTLIRYGGRFQDVMFSFLPLAHMFERMMETVAFMIGMRVGYYGGNIKTVVDDIKELRPTLLPLVPRVLNRIYDKVEGGKGRR
ncbi:Long-chain-fatty-acid--CoA ligase 6 [Toxocara canis]|uniref:long-chain-fatty-acid--CoA ligase n=1 Tax=Toxocara canis TaxID=6265 RepID=A0A0B2USE7_TOXCA|nr:Long-chain-fatty-acid--CoA ligase 6 [Toxocara canis]